MPDEPNFAAVFAEMDALGFSELSEEKPRVVVSADTRLRDSFREITAFVEKNGREPRKQPTNIKELELAARLADFRENPEKMKAVLDIDFLNLLPHEDASMDDIMADLQPLEPELDIFDVSGLPTPRNKPEYIASRKPCTDFEQYRQLFVQCQADLIQNRRHIVRVAGNKSPSGLGKGSFAIVRHVMCYIADESDEVTYQFHKKNKRLRVIYENGTESDILLLTLVRALYEGGCIISERDEDTLKDMVAGEEDVETGIIYVLKSKSKDSAIRAIPHLYKIGVSTQRLEERIAHAEQEPTYLMSEVEPVIHFACYDLDVNKMENLVHRVFADAQVVLEVTDSDGRVCHPREWFSVPISVIKQAVQMILDGNIVHFRYDRERMRMVEKEK